MNKRKIIYILIVILLIILMIWQIIYFNKKNNNKNTTNAIDASESYISEEVRANIIEQEQLDKHIEVGSLSIIYDEKYKGSVSIDTIKKELYKFLYTNILKIRELTNNKDSNEIYDIYNSNKDTITAMNITSEDDFEGIVNELKEIKYDETVTYNNSIAMLNTYENTDDNYGRFLISFNLKDENSETRLLSLYVKLANNDSLQPQIIYQPYNELDKIYSNYTGQVSKNKFIELLDKFKENIPSIEKDTAGKSDNARLQYYDNNKEKLNEIGIYSREDCLSIIQEINGLVWKNSPQIISQSYSYREVNEQKYARFIVMLQYTGNGIIRFEVWVSTDQNITPEIILKPYEIVGD